MGYSEKLASNMDLLIRIFTDHTLDLPQEDPRETRRGIVSPNEPGLFPFYCRWVCERLSSSIAGVPYTSRLDSAISIQPVE